MVVTVVLDRGDETHTLSLSPESPVHQLRTMIGRCAGVHADGLQLKPRNVEDWGIDFRNEFDSLASLGVRDKMELQVTGATLSTSSPPSTPPWIAGAHDSAAAAVDDAEFREFVRGFNDLSDDQDAVEPAVLVVDAGRLHWKVGDAGDDSPSDLAPEGPDGVLVGVELQRLRSGGADRSRRAEQQLLRDHRATCCTSMVEALRRRAARGQARPYKLAVVTVPLLERPDDPDGQAAWLMRQLFDRLPSLRGIMLQNQEVLSIYASGRTTGLAINLGSELSVVAVWDGGLLSDTARVVRNPQYDLLPASVRDGEAMKHWLETSGLVDAVEGAIAVAPRDTRRDLLSNLLITGGMRAQLGTAGQACSAHLPSALLCRLTSIGYLSSNLPGVRVVCPPERDCSAWIGGSIVGVLSSTYRYPEPLFISRRQYETFVALGTTASAADVSFLLGAAERTLVPAGPDLRPAAALRALAWARCLLHSDASSCAALAELPAELVVRIGELLDHPPPPHGATTPPEESSRTDAELELLEAPRLQGYEQGQDCEPQYWTEAGAEAPPEGGVALLARDRGSERIRVMLS
eukprot:COSAG02_NODE_2157_length_9637_cov_4.208429_7_plen_576_part_00